MDAKTGKVVDERHEDNIVTNAVQDALSVNPFGFRSDIAKFLPLVTNLLGGVLLQMDGKRYDNTVKHRLDAIRQTMVGE